MKNLILLGLFLALLNTIHAQKFECGDASITISDIVCLGNKSPVPSDDFLTYMVTAQNITSYTFIRNIPSTSTESGNGFLVTNMSSMYLQLDSDGVTYIQSPSPNCAPLNLTIDIFPPNGEPCYDIIAILEAPNIIPTLSQWGIIILALSIVIFGFVAIKVKSAIFSA